MTDTKTGNGNLDAEVKPAASTGTRVTTYLLATASPVFGQWVTWLLCVFALVLAISPIEFAQGVRAADPATVFWWLPETLLRSGLFFTSIRVVLAVSAIAWMFRVAVPISGWATTITFMLMWSLRMENLTNGAHIFNVTNMLLLIHAMWFHFYGHEIKMAAATGQNGFAASRCYPRWVFWLSVFYLGWFHTLAGVTKVLTTGWHWGSGTSLQLWTELFGNTSSPFAQVVLYDSRLTAVMQTGALVIELASILAIAHVSLRYLIGFGLTGFYLGVLTTFVTFGFHFNAILVALFLLPVDWLVGLKFEPPVSATFDAAVGVNGEPGMET